MTHPPMSVSFFPHRLLDNIASVSSPFVRQYCQCFLCFENIEHVSFPLLLLFWLNLDQSHGFKIRYKQFFEYHIILFYLFDFDELDNDLVKISRFRLSASCRNSGKHIVPVSCRQPYIQTAMRLIGSSLIQV